MTDDVRRPDVEPKVIPFPGPKSGRLSAFATGQLRLLDRVRLALRVRNYSVRTERAYAGWIRRFILFHDKRHPDAMGETEIEAFLSDLATAKKVSASTQNQALAALLFLYGVVLGRKLAWIGGLVHAKRPETLPVVLTATRRERSSDGFVAPMRWSAACCTGPACGCSRRCACG